MYTIKIKDKTIGTKETYQEAMKFASDYPLTQIYDKNGKLIAIHWKNKK